MTLFIALDGVDGSGKSTQAALLFERLGEEARAAGRPAPRLLREPGTTPLGERLRATLLDRDLEICAGSEALLFVAARRQSLEAEVAPALAAGRDVVIDRFPPSTFAYQGVAGALEPERVLGLMREWAGEPAPQLEVVLEVDAEAATARRGAATDRIEDKGLAFQRRVADGYRRYVECSERAVAVDGARTVEEVAADVWDHVERLRERLGVQGGAP